MKRRFRLTRSTDFKRVRRFGKSYAHPLVVLAAHPSAEQATRVAVAAGVNVGGAVERNRAKRRLRACLDDLFPRILPGWDLIVIARKPLLQAEYPLVCAAIVNLLERAGALQKEAQDNCG